MLLHRYNFPEKGQSNLPKINSLSGGSITLANTGIITNSNHQAFLLKPISLCKKYIFPLEVFPSPLYPFVILHIQAFKLYFWSLVPCFVDSHIFMSKDFSPIPLLFYINLIFCLYSQS